jgi:5S rRNA maturation endonuclease (ribonuclease M5)
VKQRSLKQRILSYFGEDFTSYYQPYVDESHIISNGDYATLCPLHPETDPSFHYKPKTGEWYCHADKEGGDIFKFYALKHGLSLNGQFPQILKGIARDFNIPIDTAKPEKRKIVAHYDYTDEKGKVVHRTIKYNPKSYKQCTFKEGEGWVWSLKGSQTYLYNLPDVIKKHQIWICEGEKDSDTVNSLGIKTVAATSNPMGAKKWKKQYNEYLKDKDCVLFPDNDEEGRLHMDRIAASLNGIAKSIKIVPLPDLPHKGDVTDFVEKQKSRQNAREAILKIVNETEPHKPPPTLAEEIEKMNEKHAVVMVGGKCCVLNETRDVIFDNRRDFTLSPVNDFRHYHKNKNILIPDENGDFKERNVADEWLKSPERRTCKGIVFNPSQLIVPGHYNLYRGLPVEPKEGKWNDLQDHIYEVWANNNVEQAEYVFNWMAYKLQNLGKKRCDVALVLRGERGAGKGIGVQFYGNLFSPHFVHITNQAHVTGRFNSLLKDALVVYIDEAFWAGDKNAEGILKALITEDIIVIEFKGKDAFRVKKHADFMVASNNSRVVPAGFKERRFFVLDVSSKKIGDKVWFERIIEQMNNGGKEAMLYDLLKWDISNFDPRDFPRTPALAEQIIASMDSVQKFWYTALQAGEINSKETSLFQYHDFGDWIATEDLYEAYEVFCKRIKERYPVISNVLMKNLKKLCPDMRGSKRSVEGRRKQGYSLPDLERCKELFDEVIGFKLQWDERESTDSPDAVLTG